MTNRDDISPGPVPRSGSTLIADEKTGRCCRGLELDPRYVDVILGRFAKLTERFFETGETFNELTEWRLRETEDAPLSRPYRAEAKIE